jgi:hypothetical protein
MLENFSNDKISGFVENQVENIQKVGISDQSKLPQSPAPSITDALRCQQRPPKRNGLIQPEIMCLKAVDLVRSQDFIWARQNRPDRERACHFAGMGHSRRI